MRYLTAIMLLCLLVGLGFGSTPVAGQPEACDFRPTRLDEPWMRTGLSCLEEVINAPEAGELGFTALATAPDGTLYAARPVDGQIFAFRDTDGNEMPDSPRVVADGLTLPNGLDYFDGALYIAGGAHIYRLRDDVLETLVDDLPTGGGFWTGGIAVANDRIYVATGAPCDFCTPDDPERGVILSFALDGSDRQLVASGLRQPADLAFDGADLWVVDSAPSELFETPDLDEVNRVEAGADYGFPNCVGANMSDGADGICNTTVPVIALPTGSTPTGIAAYQGDAIPSMQGKLLVVLNGSYNDLDLRGYLLVAADPQTGMYEEIMPARPDDSPGANFTAEQMNYRGSGFFPRRPLDVAVSDEGWVYISVSGGRILLMRPENS